MHKKQTVQTHIHVWQTMWVRFITEQANKWTNTIAKPNVILILSVLTLQ
jgi:hypothetical protein